MAEGGLPPPPTSFCAAKISLKFTYKKLKEHEVVPSLILWDQVKD